MRDVEVYNIDDQEYMLLNKVTKNDTTYLYFSNISKGDDYIIRKIDKDNQDSIIPLDDEEEVKIAILLLTNRQLEYN